MRFLLLLIADAWDHGSRTMMKSSPDELRAAVERAEHKLNLARKKFSQFKNNEMDVTDPSHRRGLRWLDDEVSKAETELASARHKLEND